jgi:hypothetical protein
MTALCLRSIQVIMGASPITITAKMKSTLTMGSIGI